MVDSKIIVDLLINNMNAYPYKIGKTLSNVLNKLDELGILYSESTEKSINSLYDSLTGGDWDRSYNILENLYASYYKIRGFNNIKTFSVVHKVSNCIVKIQQDAIKGTPITLSVYELQED